MRRVIPLLLLAAGLLVGTTESPAAVRKVLAELFTSTTCSPCYAADVFYMDNWLPNYGGADQIVSIAYHVWWPSAGDPMYDHNRPPVQTRVSYYGTNSVPNMRVDGYIDAGFNYPTWPGAIEPRFLDASPVEIQLSGYRNNLDLVMTAKIIADRPVNSSTWRVHWAVVESGINANQNSPSGYVPFVHQFAHRGMYPDGNGSPITISQGDTVTLNRTITMSPVWVPNNCRVVVFVQNNTDKKVQNAESIPVEFLTGVDDPPTGAPQAFVLDQNYPNPFNPQTQIRFTLPERAAVSLKVYDLLGREAATLLDGETAAGAYTVPFDASGLAAGVYIYRLTADGRSAARQMILLR
jgi:hypothetical protein